jgi:serine/threonine-protein kinase
MTDQRDDPVQALISEGRHEEAASLAVARGEFGRAVDVYEKLWRFDEALALAERNQDRPRAVRLALEARRPERARALAAEVASEDRDELLRVADAFAGRGVFDDAARAAERAGALERAADYYHRASAEVDAARVLLAAGRLREAAQRLELVLASGAGPRGGDAERASAELLLGRLLARLGRPLEAARALQSAARRRDFRDEAWRSLCGVLLALGYPHAAEEIARRLHALCPELPPSAEQIAGELPAAERQFPDRFAVERLLGSGATGRVYLAEDRLTGRMVALKSLSVGASGIEEEAVRRFLREAEAAGRLRHPHIVALFDVDVASGLLVFEYMAGGSLEDLLAGRGRLSPASVRRLGLELLSALGAAHEVGIVHRDVKPANVFLDAAGGAKLGDFGAAHLQDFGQTQTGGLIGTLAYISPEQVTGDRIGPEADLYSLGCTLYEALTGRPPFSGPDFVSQHLAEPPVPPGELIAGIDAAVDDVILRALRKAPEERFGSSTEMAEAVSRWPVEHAIARIAAREAPPSLPAEAANQDVGEVVVELGPVAGGRLIVRHDPRVDRDVLVERRSAALSEEDVTRIKRLAAAGGPHVQRVTSLDVEAGEITYEWLAAELTAFASLSRAEVEDLKPVWARLEPLGLSADPGRPIARTAGGPVVLVQPVVIPT